MNDAPELDLATLVVPRWGWLVETADRYETYRLIDPDGVALKAVAIYFGLCAVELSSSAMSITGGGCAAPAGSSRGHVKRPRGGPAEQRISNLSRQLRGCRAMVNPSRTGSITEFTRPPAVVQPPPEPGP